MFVIGNFVVSVLVPTLVSPVSSRLVAFCIVFLSNDVDSNHALSVSFIKRLACSMGSNVLFVASCLLLVSHFIAPCSLPKFPSRRVFFFLSGVVHLQTTSSFNYEFTLK